MQQKPLTTPLPVCAAVIIDQGRILLTRRPDGKKLGGYWEFPGGKVDPGESLTAALVRELREELAIDIEVGRHLATVSHRYPWGEVFIHAFFCRWRSGTIRHLEVADHAWTSPDDLDSFRILPADAPLIQRLQQPGALAEAF